MTPPPSHQSSRLSPSLLTAALLSATTLTGCVVGVDSQALIVRDEKRFDVSGTPDLTLTTFDGRIEVRSWDRNEVLVEIEKRGADRDAVSALDVKATQDGNRIALEVKRPREETFSGFGHFSASARLIVSVPRNTNLSAQSGDGSIKVERISGRVDLRSGDGSIEVNDTEGEITLHTGDGSINVTRASGTLAAETGDGGVSVAGRLSKLRVETGDGSIVARIDEGAVMEDDWDLTTGDGSVTLYVPRGFSANLDAHTGDGSVRSELRAAEAEQPADSDRGDREGSRDRRSLRSRLGDGGHTLRIRTNDGSIRIRES